MKTYDPKKMKVVFSITNPLTGEKEEQILEGFSSSKINVDVASKRSALSGSISLTLSSDQPINKFLKRILRKLKPKKPRKIFHKKKKYKWYR